MSDEAEPIVFLRGGENTPIYRSRESKADLLASLASEAVEKAVEKGADPGRLEVRTRWSRGRREPHTAYGEVEVLRR